MTDHHDRSVDRYIASLDDEQAVKDSETLIEMMQRISGHEPTLWNVGTIGFGTYHYQYDSGREGDGHTIGFYPRKGKLTIYLMDGTARHSELLAKLGSTPPRDTASTSVGSAMSNCRCSSGSSKRHMTSSSRSPKTGRYVRSCGKPTGNQ